MRKQQHHHLLSLALLLLAFWLAACTATQPAANEPLSWPQQKDLRLIADSISLLATPVIVAVIVMLLRHSQTKTLAPRYHLRLSDRHIALAGALPFVLIGFARAFVQNGSVATLTPVLSGLAWAATVIVTGLLLRRL